MRTAESKQKAIATRAAKNELHASQTVVIDKDWRIERIDDMNWQVLHKDKFNGYYGRLTHALKALPDKMLATEARGSLTQIVATLQSIEARIDQCVSKLK